MKRWKLLDPVPEAAFEALSGVPKRLAALLWRRGIRTAEEAERFLHPSWERDVHDPFLFDDMRKAVDRLMAAVRDGEKIVVHGDYDADGVSGSVILHSVLKGMGAQVEVFLPHREKEGYGISSATVERIAREGAKVMITTDCGISNGKEIALGNALGIDTIVTDHHTLPSESPAAYAILHPLREGERYPFKHLTGGGVAFKLAQALWATAGLPPGQEKWLLDMVSISTVADMGKLVGENRALVHYGLVVLNKTRRVGLGKLVEATSRGTDPVDVQSIGFRIAPRINAAGRMDHANGAFDLLTAETEEVAVERAEKLHQHNRDRQAATEIIVAEARVKAAAMRDGRAIVVRGDGWPAALCGLVASRLVDEHGKPVIALGRDEQGKHVGSGRSIHGFDVTGALRDCAEHILKFGGHPAACGLTIEGDDKFDAFERAFLATAASKLEGADLTPTLEIEETIAPEEVTLELVESIKGLEPHGVGNPRPLFRLDGARVVTSSAVGENGKHLRLVVAGGRGTLLTLIAFGFGERLAEFPPGTALQAVVELSVNEWNGRRSPQGRVVDLRTA